MRIAISPIIQYNKKAVYQPPVFRFRPLAYTHEKRTYYWGLSLMKTNNKWASKMGFILATAGAAIGLGNLWKFPYLMGRNGGFPFLVAYLFFICILGVPVMITEMSLGRKTGKNPVLAYDTMRLSAAGLSNTLSAMQLPFRLRPISRHLQRSRWNR